MTVANGKASAERRRKHRYGIRGSTVKYRKPGLFSLLAPASARYLLLNFSETGLNFLTREPLSVGQGLNVVVGAPRSTIEISAHGRVAWVRKSSEFDAYHVGIEFTGLSDETRVDLRTLLDTAVLEKVELTSHLFVKEIESL